MSSYLRDRTLASGYLALGQEPTPDEAPKPRLDLKQSFTAAGDEFSMCTIVLTTGPVWVGARASRIGRETEDALDLFEQEGWLDFPTGYHTDPPPIEKLNREPLRYKKRSFEHLSFESGYEPHPEEPVRERWLAYEENRTAHAWVLHHPGEPRPWLVGLHGIRMGFHRGDFMLYRPDHLHHKLGLNLLLPILPIHGPRKAGPISGDRILSGDVMDTVHAGTQAIWDVRRLLGWLRLQDAPGVGVVGYSLGGYTAALLAGLESDVDCVIASNPAVDPSGLFWRNALSLTTRYLKTEGVTEQKMEKLMHPVAPLAFTPQISHERRAIFCGVADRVVPASEAASLWRHWEQPRINWYQGSHRGFLRTHQGEKFIEETLRATGVLVDSSLRKD
ncbi:alpha/beta hydrolase [soil metagenome]